MKTRRSAGRSRRLGLARGVVGLALLLGLATPASASAGPALSLDIHHSQTNFHPGGEPAVSPVSTLTQGGPSTNEQQQFGIFASAGQFKLTVLGQTTADMSFNASPGAVQAALQGLPAIGAGDVSVVKVDTEFTVTFQGGLANTNIPQLSVSSGTAPLVVESEYWFDVDNVGDAATSGPLTLMITLPSGLSRAMIREASSDTTSWSCPGSAGDSTITCTTSDSIARHSSSGGLALTTRVNPALPNGIVRVASARVSGGGAPDAPASEGCPAGIAACAVEPTRIDSADAGFGIIADSFTPDFLQADGVTPVREAGSHPDRFVVPFDFNTIEEPAPTPLIPLEKISAEGIRNLIVDLPAGFLGDPSVVDECKAAELSFNTCPPGSQVGVGYIKTSAFFEAGSTHSQHRVRVFNMVHPRGAVNDLAFVIAANPVHIKSELDPTRNYAIQSTVSDINETVPVLDQELTLWGVPADPSHDSERCATYDIKGSPVTTNECDAEMPRKPFLTVPASCDEELDITLHSYDSWENSGVLGPDLDYTLPGQFTDCAASQAEFNPTATVTPTNTKADTPTGLDIEARVPFNDDPDAIATPSVKRLEIKLPEGMAINPSFADGLRGCSEEEIGISHEGVPDNEKVTCPDQSRIGSIELNTPLLPTPAEFPAKCPGTAPLQGSIYLAEQYDNPTNSLFAIYTIIEDCEDRGLVLKLPGSMDLNPDTGQITSTFEDLPQFPFDKLNVKFRGGDRAPLINPPTCGTKEFSGELNTWAMPGETVEVGSSFQITEGPDGKPCAPILQSRPFNPDLNAGTTQNKANSYSPFVLRTKKPDGTQEYSSITAELPPGLTGKLAGVTRCSESTIAGIPTEPKTGQAELDNPSCPANSRIGRVNAGAGAGSQPFYIKGSVYLAGPYKGAPLSLAVVTPAVAGGIDLGNVVIRVKLEVDPTTAEVSAVSDPLPQIIHGVPIHLRDVRVIVDRNNFMRTPTNCDPMAVQTTISGSSGATATPSNPYKVSGCQSLGFAPDLKVRIGEGKADTRPNAHPSLHALLTPTPGNSNIASAQVALPEGVFLDQERLSRICSRPNYAAGTCPEVSRIGYAKATTPLLDEPVEGPVYLKASDNPLPDMTADLNGLIDFDLSARIDQTERKGNRLSKIRSTFDVVPDVPVSSFELEIEGGDEGLLVNSRNVCGADRWQRLEVFMAAHNEDFLNSTPLVDNACPDARVSRLMQKAKKLKQKAKALKKKAKKASPKQAKKLRKKAKRLQKKAKRLQKKARKAQRAQRAER